MDLSLLHFGPNASDPGNWKMKDKLNGWTGRGSCRFLEWSGWYSFDLAERLLGHYRLFQLFKKKYAVSEFSIPIIQAYILRYRRMHWATRLFARLWASIDALSFPKTAASYAKIESFNRILIRDNPLILHKFLHTADENFEQAFRTAIRELNAPEFLQGNKGSTHVDVTPILLFLEQNNYTSTTNNSYTHNEINIHHANKEGAKGKEKDVFSKKQVLIFFDLLSEAVKLERIDLSKPGRYEALANLLHALTGKGKASFIEELKDHRNHGLYHFNTEGELNQLISTLTNLGEICRAAGFRSIATFADKKIRELEMTRKDQ